MDKNWSKETIGLLRSADKLSLSKITMLISAVYMSKLYKGETSVLLRSCVHRGSGNGFRH